MNNIMIGKWFFASDNLTVTDPNGTINQLEILGFTALRQEIAAVSVTHSWGVYYVTERKLKVADFDALCLLPDPTPEQVARMRELADWIPTTGNPLRDNRNYEEL